MTDSVQKKEPSMVQEIIRLGGILLAIGIQIKLKFLIAEPGSLRIIIDDKRVKQVVQWR